MDYASLFSVVKTPQSEPIPGAGQVPNQGGGFVWAVDDWTKLDRFLILGNEGGSYYAAERKMTRENAESVLRCLLADPGRTIERIASVSESGRAPKNDPAIFALALCAGFGDGVVRQAAFLALERVCRIGTHLFHFLAAYEQLRPAGPKAGDGKPRGRYGRSVRRALAHWYLDKTVEDLAYEVVKYRQRDGWAHRDVLRLCHGFATHSVGHRAILRWLAKGLGPEDQPDGVGLPVPLRIHVFEQLQKTTDPKAAAALIREHRMPREAVLPEVLNTPAVWEALLEDMPLTAMIRNLATLTRQGVVAPMNAGTAKVVAELGNVDRLKRSRVHPIQLLTAQRTYQAGHGVRAQDKTWVPVSQILDALDQAFYDAFSNLAPRPQRLVIALDVSGSMATGEVAGVPNLSPREASAAMALVLMHQFPVSQAVAFACGGQQTWKKPAGMAHVHGGSSYPDGITPVDLSPRMRIVDAVNVTQRYSMGGTDCALPMLWAAAKKVPADAFVVLTDSETWAGGIHPAQALQAYRQSTGIPAKLVVVGMVANEFSIADPRDAGMLDVVGFDTNVPQLMADFVG